MPKSDAGCYTLDREELLRIRELKLLTSDRDYIFWEHVTFAGSRNA